MGKITKILKKGNVFTKIKVNYDVRWFLQLEGFYYLIDFSMTSQIFFCSSQLEGKFSILQLEGFAVRGVLTVLVDVIIGYNVKPAAFNLGPTCDRPMSTTVPL